jgi:hypothetical protein
MELTEATTLLKRSGDAALSTDYGDALRTVLEAVSPQKVYLVLWEGAYMEDGNGISGVYLSHESAQTEADRLTTIEDEDRKKRRSTYPSTYYEVTELDVLP